MSQHDPLWQRFRGRTWLTTGHSDSPLRAFDALDEAFVDHWPGERVAVVGERFGSLAVHRWRQTKSVVIDSACGRAAMNSASTKNEVHAEFHILSDLDPWTQINGSIVLRAPQAVALFRWRLARAWQLAPTGSKVLIGARKKDWSSGHQQVVDQLLNDVQTVDTNSRLRVLQGRLERGEETDDVPWRSYQALGDTEIWSLPGVFAHGRLDGGTRQLIEALDLSFAGRDVVDLGAGPGVLAAAVAERGAKAVIATDDSALAIGSCERTLAPWSDIVTCLHSDVGETLEAGCADVVLCNPPFHLGRAQSGHIVDAMLLCARRALRPRGQLWLVGNRHLDHGRRLKRFFASSKVARSELGFEVFVARR
ncbi:MAG TPA: hypothetical protein DCQ06_13620 [Myxococcales bacterium]|nr:hypothetical protein [Myxococcales bacterium]